MRFRVDIENAAGTVLGHGPLQSVSSWKSTRRMDKAGGWSFVMDAGDPQRSLVQPKRMAAIYALLDQTWTWVGGGRIDQIERSVGDDGRVLMTVSGQDPIGSLREWIYSGTFNTELSSILATIDTACELDVTIIAAVTPPNAHLYVTLQYDSILAALVRMVERAQTHFYLHEERRDEVVVNHVWADSGVRAVQARGLLTTRGGVIPDAGKYARQAAILRLEIAQESWDVVTTVWPLGAGNAGAALTMAATSETAPAGYVLNAAANRLDYMAGVAEYGYIHRAVQFRDIRPVSGTDADLDAAADLLFQSALYWLQRHQAPVTSYRLQLGECSTMLRPLQTLRVIYRDSVAGLEIDEDLYVLEATWAGNADGMTTTDVVVATADRWPEDDAGSVVESIAQGSVYQVHPQLNANSYVIPYYMPVDEDETAQLRFRFDAEVLQVNRVTLDVKLTALESTVKSVGGTSVSTAASGDHTHSVTVGSHTHSVTVGNHNHDVTVANHTHGVTIGDHTHGVTIDDHDHDIYIEGDTNPTANYATARIVYYAPGPDLFIIESAGGSDEAGTTEDGGGDTVTSASGGGTTVTSASGGGTTATSTDGGGTTVTSASGGGTTVTSASGGSHTHSVTAAIAAEYGIYRDSSSNLFDLEDDLEYSVDGATWYRWIPAVNGYATLGDSWVRVDLTDLLTDTDTLRPLSSNNAVQVRRRAAGATGKAAMINAQLNVRTIIQAVALA
jgi:hypothetical protein